MDVAPRTSNVELQEVEFLFGVPTEKVRPNQSLPEIAIIGRSNVGKSSFLNRLTGKKIARVSATPGCTTEFNYYRVRGRFAGKPLHAILVDIPGFGFAKLSKQKRERINEALVSYLRDCDKLHGVILLNDCRREPQDDELAVQQLCADGGVPLFIVITKLDLLNQKETHRALRSLAAAYHVQEEDLIPTGRDHSTDSLWGRLVQVLS